MKLKEYFNFLDDFLEFRLRPFVLSYLILPINFYTQHLVTFRSDVKTILNYYLLKRKKKPSFKTPKTITIAPTNICNANCVFCAYRFLNYKKESIHAETYKKVLNEFKELGGKKIIFSPTIGEDLVNKDFFNIVNYAKKEGFYIYVFTNGILLNRNDNYKKIIDSGIDDIVVSTGDIIQKYEAEILGISQELALQKINGLIKLLEYKIKTKSPIKITIGFRSKRPFRKIWKAMKNSKLKRFFDAKIVHIAFKTRYDNWCGNITQKDLLGIMRLKRGAKLKRYPCRYLRKISVLSNGDVRLCACRIKDNEHDGLVIGNVTTNSLNEIINSEKRRDIIFNWRDGQLIEVCKECVRYRF